MHPTPTDVSALYMSEASNRSQLRGNNLFILGKKNAIFYKKIKNIGNGNVGRDVQDVESLSDTVLLSENIRYFVNNTVGATIMNSHGT